MTLDDLPTPCLLIERSRLKANLERMQAKAAVQRVALRPHIKTHKSAAIAQWQEELGAKGITVAKPGEAEVFAEAGFADVRLAYAVVGEEKHERLLRLMETGTHISFCVDTEAGAQAASVFYAQHGRQANVLIEVDVGYGRCGVPWDARELADFVRLVSGLPGLRLVGILTHEGHAYHGPSEGETSAEALARVAAETRDRMLEVAVRLRTSGVAEAAREDFSITIGSTPSMAAFENAERDGFRITEIRPGNYVFNDGIQVALGAATLQDCALTALATVISKRRDDVGRERLYLDAGKKVFTSDQRPGSNDYGVLLYNAAAMRVLPHARIVQLSEEHGWVDIRGGATLDVGDRVRIVPNHACVAVNTQDRLWLVDGQDVAEEIAVDARGRVQ